jgi:magnesium transporter
VIVSCSVYRADGAEQPRSVAMDEIVRGALAPDTFAWVDVTDPVQDDFHVFASEFDLHELAIEDAVEAGQRPKVEQYGDTLVAVFRPARLDHSGSVVYDELFVSIGDQFVLTVAHGPLEQVLEEARRRMLATGRLPNGPGAALHAIADVVVDGYVHLMRAKEHAFELAETAVFSEQPPRRIGQDLFRHKREVLQLWQAGAPLVGPLDALIDDRRSLVGEDVRQYLRDVSDHLKSVVARLETHRDLLTDAFDVNVAQVGVKQNEDMRKMSAWAALLLLPTLLVGLWGMNFESMPELDEPWGYPMALGIILLSCLALGLWFRRIEWL